MNLIVDLEIADNIWLRTHGEYTPGRAGKYYGPPERCYPDESPEYDFNSADMSLVVEIRDKKHIFKADPELADLYDEDIQIAADCEYAYQCKQLSGDQNSSKDIML